MLTHDVIFGMLDRNLELFGNEIIIPTLKEIFPILCFSTRTIVTGGQFSFLLSTRMIRAIY